MAKRNYAKGPEQLDKGKNQREANSWNVICRNTRLGKKSYLISQWNQIDPNVLFETTQN